MRLYPFLLLVAMALSGCFQASGNPEDALSPGIPMPTGVQALPAEGVLTVSVYIEGETTPSYVDDDLGLDQEEIALVFDAPVGQHVFIVIFDYLDPEFPRDNGEPWELARWSSDLVTVAEGEGLSLDVEVEDYQYEDFDGDGVTNKDELIARTDPGDDTVFPDFLVSAEVGEGGSISPPDRMVIFGSTAAFTVTATTGYTLLSVTGCDGTLDGDIYTTGVITADCTVSASFSLDSHSVETNAGTGGTISPERQTVDHGASATFRLFLAEGFDFSEVSVSGCNGTLTQDGVDLIYTTGAITAPCTVSATFSLTEYAVSAEVVGGGGVITPASRIVSHGSTTSFTATPAPGFSIASVAGCDGTLNQNTFTTGAVTAACVVSARFSVNSYAVTATAGPNGSISPASLLVDHGSTASFTVTPETGYSAIVEGTCGGALEDNTYTTDAVTGGCTVAAAFTQDQYTLTYLAGQNGSIDGDSAQTVGHGDSGTAITAVPDQGYSFVEWSDGSTANPRTDNVVTGDLSVTASFTLNQHEITATAGEGGSIAPLSQVVDHGQTASFTIAPSIFHAISSVTGCDGNLGGLIYTTGAITGACVVDARFTEVVPTGLVALADDGEVSIGWSQVADATGYRVYWGNRAAIHPDILNSYDDSASIGDVTTHTVRGLTNDSLYYFVVTATATAGESGPSAEVSATPQSTPVATGLLNDTGIDWCADGDDHLLACPQASHPGQDGDRGRDAEARDGTLQKTGTGMAGFDFTKLDADGNVLASNAGEWSCVRDNHTGLVWEVKVDDRNHLRHRDHTYSWYRPDTDDNGGNAGTRDRGSCAGSDCDTHALVLAVNAQRLCGAGGWRLPTRNDLISLVHNGRPGGARIDIGHFPNTVDSSYWSSSPFSNNANRAWSVDFDDGEVDANNKNSSIRVRLVRAGRSAPVAGVSCTGQNSGIIQTTPGADFTDLDGGAVVRHATTRLEWQRCALGQEWDSGQCSGSATTHSWQGALEAAAAAGGGWRLPNRNELASIVEEACRQPAINTQIFPNTPANAFWSSSPDVDDEDDAWVVEFNHGVVEPDDMDDRNRVRLVRP